MKNVAFAILLLVSISLSEVQASFKEGFLPAQEIALNLYQKFHGINVGSDSYSSGCQVINRSSMQNLGYINPTNGESSAPGVPFMQWHEQCVDSYIGFVFKDVPVEKEKTEKVLREIFKTLLPKIEDQLNIDNRLFRAVWVLPLSNLTEEEISKHVDYLIFWCLGTDEEILYYGKVHDLPAFKKGLIESFKEGQYLGPGTLKIIRNLLSRDEFLMY